MALRHEVATHVNPAGEGDGRKEWWRWDVSIVVRTDTYAITGLCEHEEDARAEAREAALLILRSFGMRP